MAHDQEVVGSNPGTVYWMDVSYYIKVKLKIKIAKWGTPKKYLKKNTYSLKNCFKIVIIKKPVFGSKNS
jgi:hypothetical protein